ncbi:Protein-lysine N-methyltransferase efm5 [Neophaeococcomyces mojaviensis]|uniref:Protein-lysine N-methyltransferase efm5 n=1 Tax=Neophaeococcomyces mojaviensis TaxID=3383035 RepID=A0ACC3A9A6_9EURO|nr:Protein-lysine N-methyltransferase efm5 [Knufia sp. JES_112]
MDNDDEDRIVLSGNALAALQDFYNQRDKDLEAFEQLTSEGSNRQITSISTFKEDWNASQFWVKPPVVGVDNANLQQFTDATARLLAEQLVQGSTSETSIAVVSAPSVFVQLKNLLATGKYPTPARICLFEYDERFGILGDFVKFDFNKPTNLPPDLRNVFDRILCDPPYHSTECILKYAETVEWLWKGRSEGTCCESRRVICTGQTMKDVVLEAFAGMKQDPFEPEHTARLDNKYACFADFELQR